MLPAHFLAPGVSSLARAPGASTPTWLDRESRLRGSPSSSGIVGLPLNQINELTEQLIVRNGENKSRDLGLLDRSSGSAREFVDRMTEHPELDRGLNQQTELLRSAIEAEKSNKRARERVAELLREEIQDLEQSS